MAPAKVSARPRQQQHSARIGSSTAASDWPWPIWCAWASPITYSVRHQTTPASPQNGIRNSGISSSSVVACE